jgi:hypothetical protein
MQQGFSKNGKGQKSTIWDEKGLFFAFIPKINKLPLNDLLFCTRS